MAQFQQEEIHFKSANPFSLSDVILHLDKLETQAVYGQLTLPVDSLNPQKKYPLVIGVASRFLIKIKTNSLITAML